MGRVGVFTRYRILLAVLGVFAVSSCGRGNITPPGVSPALARLDVQPYIHVVPFIEFQGHQKGYTPFDTPGGRHGLIGGVMRMFGSAPAGGDNCAAGKGKGCGVIYELTPTNGQSTYAETVLLKFTGANGAVPYASVSVDPNYGDTGDLYGTTFYGGQYNGGTVFVLHPAGSGYTERIIHNFGKGSDGAHPFAGVNDINGVLYGTTIGGGKYTSDSCKAIGRSPDGTCGALYSINLKTDAERVLHSFGATGDGASPYSGVTYDNYNKQELYGTTLLGGSAGTNCGTVYSVTPSGIEHILYTFAGSPDGCRPHAGVYADLVESSGYVYGTTSEGGIGIGQKSGGTIFRVNVVTGAELVLYRFGASVGDGLRPDGFLHHVSGAFYGTTSLGGGSSECKRGCGTAFSIGPTGTNYKTLARFDGGSTGQYPTGGLLYADGSFYGITSSGGKDGFGAGFKLTP
jgi:uncharacterized repeat protein (TIGR03803 family)